MARSMKLLTVALAGLAPHAVFGENSTNGTNGTTAVSPADQSLTVMVDVLGQSGKFTLYEALAGKAAGITVEMDSLKEVDENGEPVGSSGNVKHSINTFAAQDFTVSPVVSDSVNGVKANKVSFSSDVSTVGSLAIDTYVMAEDGEVGSDSEKWNVSRGDLKWNINFTSWTFCGCGQGQKVETGAFIDLTVKVKGLGDAEKSSNKSIGLGSGVGLQLSNRVNVDGTWQAMPEGFPRIATQGSSITLTFRFPKFTSSALYDPVITGFAAATSTGDGSDGADDDASNNSVLNGAQGAHNAAGWAGFALAFATCVA